MRIYIAGPYLPKDCSMHDAARVAQRNVDNAIKAFHFLKAMGHTPFVPVLSHYLHIHSSCTEDYGEWWYSYDMTFLENWAEGIYMLEGYEKSKGAKMELEKAEKLGLSIFFESDGVGPLLDLYR